MERHFIEGVANFHCRMIAKKVKLSTLNKQKVPLSALLRAFKYASFLHFDLYGCYFFCPVLNSMFLDRHRKFH
jgi:hypothetical protein